MLLVKAKWIWLKRKRQERWGEKNKAAKYNKDTEKETYTGDESSKTVIYMK